MTIIPTALGRKQHTVKKDLNKYMRSVVPGSHPS